MSNIMYIVALVATIWVLYEVWTQQKGMSTGSKIIWSICALLFSIITAIVFFFMKKK